MELDLNAIGNTSYLRQENGPSNASEEAKGMSELLMKKQRSLIDQQQEMIVEEENELLDEELAKLEAE